tara:strand:- start:11139 stop:11882 length:744 start_codon:yes stop_codon:yes gene_type:complete
MALNEKQYGTRRGEIGVPHRGKVLNFMLPPYGLDNESNLGQYLEQAGLRKPTMAELASFTHSIFHDYPRPISEWKRGGTEDNHVWARDVAMGGNRTCTSTGALYVPGDGVYFQDGVEIFQDYGEIKGRVPSMNKSDLVRRLEEGDPSVRHIPFGYKNRSMSPRDLARSEFLIGLTGPEEAEKLAEVASKLRHDPFLFANPYSLGLVPEDQPITRPSTLRPDLHRNKLILTASSIDQGIGGIAFGIKK